MVKTNVGDASRYAAHEPGGDFGGYKEPDRNTPYTPRVKQFYDKFGENWTDKCQSLRGLRGKDISQC